MKIGFPLSRDLTGPSLFMHQLRQSIERQRLARTTAFLNPFTDINIYASVARNPWGKPYLLRLDGISYDKALSDQENYFRNHPIYRSIDGATGIVMQSHWAKKLIERFHPFGNVPLEIIPNGVDLRLFSCEGIEHRAELGISRNEIVFISSAKWRAHKRLDSVIEVYRRYRKEINTNCRLVVLGQLDSQKQCDVLGVHYIGQVPHEELASWYRTADVCLFFSWLDTCPNTVVEALACGLPVVCTNQGGTRELVESTSGGIVVAADAPFSLEHVELYNPPVPDLDALLKAVIHVVDNRKKIVSNMDRSKVDIDIIARRYIKHVVNVYNTRKTRKPRL